MMFKMGYLLAKDDIIGFIIVPIGFAVFLLLIYGGFCLFIRWLRAWKPLPKGIRVVAWLFYACAVLVCIANFILKDVSVFFTYFPFIVLAPLCYITILVYRKNHTTSDDSQTHDTHLGPVFFIVLAIIVMTLALLLLWIDKMNKQMSELNLSSLSQPDVEALKPSYDNEVDITAYPAPSQSTAPNYGLAPKAVGLQNIEFEPFVVNLSGGGGKRFLMLTMGVKAETPALATEIYQKMPKLRDVILILLSRLSYDDISTPDGKTRLQNQMLNRINAQLSSGKVKNIYFPEVMVQ